MKPVFGGAGLKGTVAEKINAMRERGGLEPIQSAAPIYSDMLDSVSDGESSALSVDGLGAHTRVTADDVEESFEVSDTMVRPEVSKRGYVQEGCAPPVHDMTGLRLFTLVSPLAANAQFALLRASTEPGSAEDQKHVQCHGYPQHGNFSQSARIIMQKNPWSFPSIVAGAALGAYVGHGKQDGFKTTAGYAALGAAFPFLFAGFLAYNKFYGKGK
tara:strand:- start:861 stop:1505 length:645 start_codon:yes stop_codon:yes gene_type:complete